MPASCARPVSTARHAVFGFAPSRAGWLVLAAVMLALASVASMFLPSDAAALTTRERGVVQDTSADFIGTECGSTDTFSLTSPSGAYGLRLRGPTEGAVLTLGGDPVATLTDVRVARRGPRTTVTWVATGSHRSCDPEYSQDPYDGSAYGWETDFYRLGFSYTRRKQVRFSRRELRSDARLAISARFDGAWDGGYGRRVSCRKTAPLRGRCSFSWFIGDAVFIGSLRSRKFVVRRGAPRSDYTRIRNRGRVKRINEYCVVTGGSNCVQYIRLSFF